MSSAAAPWWIGPAGLLGALLLRLLGRSWRIERVGFAEREARLSAGETCIFSLWHAQLLPLIYTHRHRGVAVLISRHRDGEIIARIVERLGYVTARGSSTRGGGEGVRAMLSMAERGHLLAITPDGPRGPAEEVKSGLVFLASRTGYAVLPVGASAAAAWSLGSWDRFQVPLPFTRVVVGYGAPLAVPATLRDDEVETWRARIQGALRELSGELALRSRKQP